MTRLPSPSAAASIALLALVLAACGGRLEPDMNASKDLGDPDRPVERATFGGGCFWCTEAVFQEVDGVLAVESGYAGGTVEDPTYAQVCSGTTGHAEVVQVTFDPEQVAYVDLLEIFFRTHDPTTPDRQGADVGTQYRSIVLAHSEAQRKTAERVKAELDASGAYDAPIVTQIVDLERFHPAEDVHQDYFALNPNQPYCRAVILPKLEKFRKVFREKLKEP